MRRFFLLLTSVCVLAIGCQTNNTADEIVGVEEEGTVLAVSLEQTKTTLGEKVGDNYPSYWSDGDKLVVNGELSENAQINAENKASAIFHFPKAILSHPYYITYPYCVSTTAETPIVEFLAEQTYAKGTFASGCAPMCGYVESKSDAISLNHLSGILRFSVKAPNEGILLEKIVITSQNKIAGEFAVDCKTAEISATEGCENVVTYMLPANYTLSTTTPSDFFIVLPAIEVGACTIEFVETSGDKMVANWAPSKPLSRGIVREFKTITYKSKISVTLEPFESEEDDFIIEKPKQPNNEIWYTATAKVEPYKTDVFGANIVSNKWNETTGEGVITFDGEVTSIGNDAFYNCKGLTSIALPNSLIEIKYGAFANCNNLTNVTIPDSITSIGGHAFYNCGAIKEIVVPSNVNYLGSGSFTGCSGKAIINCKIDDVLSYNNSPFYNALFSEVIIGNNATKIGDYAFIECSKLTNISISNSVTSIGGRAFSDCRSLTSIILPNSVTSIGNYTFEDCSNLTIITIPDSITSIGSYAFNGCENLVGVYISDLSAWCKIYFDNSSANPLSNIAKLYLNDAEIVNLTIPSDITKIQNYAFYGGNSFTNITIHDSVITIGEWAFSNCINIASVTIGKDVTSIGIYAFNNCNSLTNVYCKPISPPTSGYNMFSFNSSNRKIHVPSNSVSTYKTAQYWSAYASYIEGYDF